MKYVYRMSHEMYVQMLIESIEAGMKLLKYITTYSGIRGECIKVEVTL